MATSPPSRTDGPSLSRKESFRREESQGTLNTSAVLHQLFPPQVVDKLRRGEKVSPEMFSNVRIMFADIVGWTTIANKCSPLQAHNLLDNLYSTIDFCLSHFMRLYKVETIGDSIMILQGAPVYTDAKIGDLINFCFLVNRVVPRFVRVPWEGEKPIQLRFGIHSGDVVGGIVGTLMPRYTFSGDAVNIASRIQTLGQDSALAISSSTALLIARTMERKADCASRTSAPSLSEYFERCVGEEDFVIEPPGLEFSFENFKLVDGGRRELKGVAAQRQVFYVVDTAASKVPHSPGSIRQRGSPVPSVIGLPRSRSSVNIGEQFLRLPSSTSALDSDALAPLSSVFDYSNRAYLRLNEADNKTPIKEQLAEFLRTDEHARALISRSSTFSASDNSLSLASFASLATSESSSDSDSEASVDETAGEAFPDDEAREDGVLAKIVALIGSRGSVPDETRKEELLKPALLNGLRILVVEDSFVQSKLICKNLRSINSTWTVNAVATYQEVMQMLSAANFSYDMLLLDMNLGTDSVDGVTILRNLRKLFPRFTSNLVTVMTSKDNQERELEACFNSADAFWSKPLAQPSVLASHIFFVFVSKAGDVVRRRVEAENLKKSLEDATMVAAAAVESAEAEAQAASAPKAPAFSRALNAPSRLSAIISSRQGETVAVQMSSPQISEARSVIIGRRPLSRSQSGETLVGPDGKERERPPTTATTSLSDGSLSAVASRMWRMQTPPDLRVLVVEDSTTQRKFMVKQLKACCPTWSVTAVQDSGECMRYLLAHDFAFDLLFVDMHLGEDSLAGCDLVKNLRNVHKMITQVIIGMNRDSAAIATQFLVAGADSAWKKPLPGPLVMLSRINMLLHIRRCLYGGVVGLL